MAEAKMQKIKEDQFKGADLKQSVHKRCVVISTPDSQIASIFFVVSFRVTVNPLLSPPGGGLIYFKPI